MTALLSVAVAAVVLVAVLVLDLLVLLSRRARAADAWTRVDLQLRHRHDLIAGLVDETERFVPGDRHVVQRVRSARRAAISAGAFSDPAAIFRAEALLDITLRSLHVASADVASLRIDARVRLLLLRLRAADAAVEDTGSAYDMHADRYNAGVAAFPGRVVAAAFDLHPLVTFHPQPGAVRDGAASAQRAS